MTKSNIIFQKFRVKIEEVDKLISLEEYKQALIKSGKILCHPEGITIFQLSQITESITYASEKSRQIAFGKMLNTVFEKDLK